MNEESAPHRGNDYEDSDARLVLLVDESSTLQL